MKQCFMSPIFYVNASPHIGHLYTALLCDAATRVHRQIKTADAFLTTGTDEHGLKIQKRAKVEGFAAPQLMCDQNAATFQQLFASASIGHDRFVRTTDSDHKQAVQHLWRQLQSRDALTLGSHTGFYSTNEETFFVEKDLVKDEATGKMIYAVTGEVCEQVTEHNYMFKITG